MTVLYLTPPFRREINLSVEISPAWDIYATVEPRYNDIKKDMPRHRYNKVLRSGRDKLFNYIGDRYSEVLLRISQAKLCSLTFSCNNMDDILVLHVDYWESFESRWPELKDENTTGDDGGNNGSTENRGGDEGNHNKNGFGGSSTPCGDQRHKVI